MLRETPSCYHNPKRLGYSNMAEAAESPSASPAQEAEQKDSPAPGAAEGAAGGERPSTVTDPQWRAMTGVVQEIYSIRDAE